MAILATACSSDNVQSKGAYLISEENVSTKISEISTEHTTPTTVVAKQPKRAEPSVAETKITLTEIEAKHKETLASIAAEKEKSIKQIELEQTKIQSDTRQKMSASEHQSRALMEQARQKHETSRAREDAELYRQYFYGTIALLLTLMLLIYLIHKRNQTLKAKLHEDELKHKTHTQESQQYHERINKTLEILADDATNENLKTELIGLVKDQNIHQAKLLN